MSNLLLIDFQKIFKNSFYPSLDNLFSLMRLTTQLGLGIVDILDNLRINFLLNREFLFATPTIGEIIIDLLGNQDYDFRRLQLDSVYFALFTFLSTDYRLSIEIPPPTYGQGYGGGYGYGSSGSRLVNTERTVILHSLFSFNLRRFIFSNDYVSENLRIFFSVGKDIKDDYGQNSSFVIDYDDWHESSLNHTALDTFTRPRGFELPKKYYVYSYHSIDTINVYEEMENFSNYNSYWYDINSFETIETKLEMIKFLRIHLIDTWPNNFLSYSKEIREHLQLPTNSINNYSLVLSTSLGGRCDLACRRNETFCLYRHTEQGYKLGREYKRKLFRT